MKILFFLALAVCLVMVGGLVKRRMGARQERARRPHVLRDAELVYMEQRFRIQRPLRLIARLDRAYRIADGSLVLVELKTRWSMQPHATDIIQLSAQKLAIENCHGQRVAPYAFVSIEKPDGRSRRVHRRVALLTAREVEALALRRDAVLAGRTTANYAANAAACGSCAYRRDCEVSS